ncbi:MAG TPA: serine hydrolase [Acidimicrobiales bacterium]
MLLLGLGPVLAAGARPAEPGVTSATATTAAPAPPLPKAWALADVDTGNVIDAGNDRQPLPPASLTKVITALAVTAAIAPDADITVSARAEAAPADKMFMKQGQVWTFDEMIHSLLISSANDAAVALAERAGGSIEGFEPMFAATAADLGMADHPVLNDPAGLDGPDGVEGGNLVSARDLAIAGRALLANPALAAIVATTVYHFDGPDNVNHRLTNHNKLFLTTYPGAIGMKTGFTSRAGACLIAAARRDGRTMLAVVLDGANPNQTAKLLLDEGFATQPSAEPRADRLPPVRPAAQTPPASSTGQPVAAAAHPTPAAPTAAIRPMPSSPRHRFVSRTLALILVALVTFALVGAARLRARQSRRRAPPERHRAAAGRRAA